MYVLPGSFRTGLKVSNLKVGKVRFVYVIFSYPVYSSLTTILMGFSFKRWRNLM